MRSLLPAVTAISLSALAALPAVSHHSVRAEFDPEKPIELSGTVTAIEWVNPHVLFQVELADPAAGNTVRRLELPAPNALARQGLGRDFMAIGNRVRVEAWPALNGSPRADTRSIEFADGRRLEFPESNWMPVAIDALVPDP
jgi:hypothetical protein